MPSLILTGGWPSSAHSVSRLLSQREYKTYCPGIMSTILKRCLEAAAAPASLQMMVQHVSLNWLVAGAVTLIKKLFEV